MPDLRKNGPNAYNMQRAILDAETVVRTPAYWEFGTSMLEED